MSYTDFTEAQKEGVFVKAAVIEASKLRRNFFAKAVLNSARHAIETLLRQSGNAQVEAERNAKIADENTKVANRTLFACEEMCKTPRGAKEEVPFAVLMSPMQYLQFTNRTGATHWTVRSPMRKIKLPIFTAKGVYGPTIVTEEAFKALARQAPELMLKAGG